MRSRLSVRRLNGHFGGWDGTPHAGLTAKQTWRGAARAHDWPHVPTRRCRRITPPCVIILRSSSGEARRDFTGDSLEDKTAKVWREFREIYNEILGVTSLQRLQ